MSPTLESRIQRLGQEFERIRKEGEEWCDHNGLLLLRSKIVPFFNKLKREWRESVKLARQEGYEEGYKKAWEDERGLSDD